MAKKSRSNTRPPSKSGAATPVAAPAVRSNPTAADKLADRREHRSRGRQAAAQSRRRQQRIRMIVLAVVAILAIGLGSVYAYQRITHDEPGETASDQGRTHVGTEVIDSEYNTDPPTSGDHWGSVGAWGISAEPIPDQSQIHNLEHGGIVIQYNDTLSPEEISQLENIVNQCDVKLILAPRPGMQQRVAVTAWTYYLNLDTVDSDAIQEFIDAHVDEGPEKFPSETEAWNNCN